MCAAINLDLIADALANLTDDAVCYLDIQRGEVVRVTRQFKKLAADYSKPLDAYPAWQQEQIERIWQIEDESHNYLPLPGRDDVPTLAIMEQFCESVEDRQAHHYLFTAVKGKKAYHLFKDGLERFGITDDWEHFYRMALRRIGAQWCHKMEVDCE